MKRLIASIFMLGCFVIADAQQIHQLTHYVLNDLAFNPSVSGSRQELVSKVNFRKQWAGFDGAPTTFAISAHTNFNDERAVGVGLMLFSDKTGPTSRLGVQASYAYHLPIDFDKGQFLSFGLAGLFIQNRINFNELNPEDLNDPVLTEGSDSKSAFDANFGISFYTREYYIGASLNQLIESKLKHSSGDTYQLRRHIYVMGGYYLDITDDISVEPSVLMKYVGGAPFQLDLTARAFYQDEYWVGLNYRTSDAISLLLGITFDSGLNLAYSYDITTSELKNVSNGTHEITVGYNYQWRESSYGVQEVRPTILD